MSTPLLVVDNLHVSVEDKPILKRLNLRIDPEDRITVEAAVTLAGKDEVRREFERLVGQDVTVLNLLWWMTRTKGE